MSSSCLCMHACIHAHIHTYMCPHMFRRSRWGNTVPGTAMWRGCPRVASTRRTECLCASSKNTRPAALPTRTGPPSVRRFKVLSAVWRPRASCAFSVCEYCQIHSHSHLPLLPHPLSALCVPRSGSGAPIFLVQRMEQFADEWFPQPARAVVCGPTGGPVVERDVYLSLSFSLSLSVSVCLCLRLCLSPSLSLYLAFPSSLSFSPPPLPPPQGARNPSRNVAV